jgi:hypothetical protein
MNWFDAKKACASLGNGWRLPTSDELGTLNINLKLIGEFHSDAGYWSSTEVDLNVAWLQYFYNGNKDKGNKTKSLYVRAVRTF